MKVERGSLSSNSMQCATRSWMRAAMRALERGLIMGRPPGGGLRAPERALESALDLDDLEGLDDVALAHVVVVLERDAALEALADLAHVVLLAPQRADRARVDDLRVAQEARLA